MPTIYPPGPYLIEYDLIAGSETRLTRRGTPFTETAHARWPFELRLASTTDDLEAAFDRAFAQAVRALLAGAPAAPAPDTVGAACACFYSDGYPFDALLTQAGLARLPNLGDAYEPAWVILDDAEYALADLLADAEEAADTQP
jgi:hypothetical protein